MIDDTDAGSDLFALRERVAKLEILDGLLNTLTGVLDIREVFDRVSASIDEGRRIRVHASHGPASRAMRGSF